MSSGEGREHWICGLGDALQGRSGILAELAQCRDGREPDRLVRIRHPCLDGIRRAGCVLAEVAERFHGMVAHVVVIARQGGDEHRHSRLTQLAKCIRQGVSLPTVAISQPLGQDLGGAFAAGVGRSPVGLQRDVGMPVEYEWSDGLEVRRVADLAQYMRAGEAVVRTLAGEQREQLRLSRTGVLHQRPRDVFTHVTVRLLPQPLNEDVDDALGPAGAKRKRGVSSGGDRLSMTKLIEHVGHCCFSFPDLPWARTITHYCGDASV